MFDVDVFLNVEPFERSTESFLCNNKTTKERKKSHFDGEV